jgi:pilus assembly protein CpaB
MHCTQCGKRTEDDDKYCRFCGAIIAGTLKSTKAETCSVESGSADDASQSVNRRTAGETTIRPRSGTGSAANGDKLKEQESKNTSDHGGDVVRHWRLGSRTLVVLLSLVVVIGAAFVANDWIVARVMPDQQAEGNSAHIVAAARSIPFATKIGPRHLKLIEMPEGLVPEGVFDTVEDVVGQVSITAISRGEILFTERFRPHTAGSSLAVPVSQNMRAVTVRVDDVVAVFGFLLPGNTVDVLTSRKRGQDRAIPETILRNIKVLAVDQTASAGTNEPVIVRAVTLEVLPRQAEVLFQARTEGSIQLTLRNPLNPEYAPPPGSTRSQDCKEAAANKWLLDYTMEHGNPSYEQTLEAVKQVAVFSEAIRKFCGDNRINNEILQSAKQGTRPHWIDFEISKLLAQLGR